MNKKPWVIYGQSGETVAKIRVGSVRFGRTMRAAKEINRYVNGKVFISQDDSVAPSPAGRHYATTTA